MIYRTAGARRAFARDALWLALAQGVQYAVPLVLVPYLAHTLGVARWGDVAAVLAAGNLLALLPAYGFQWTAARTLAQAPTDAARRACIAGTAGVRAGLTGIAVGLGALLAATVGQGAPLAWAGVAYVAAQGVTWGWAFEGRGRYSTAALLYVLARAPVPLLVLLCVHTPAHAARVPLAYAAASLAETGAGFWLLRRAGWLGRPAWRDVQAALRDGGWLFAGQLAVLSYVGGNPLWVRLLASPATAGVYGAAEAVVRAATGLLQPLSRALVPRMSRNPDAHRAGVWAGLVIGGTFGAAAAVALYAGAPLVPRLLGSGFAPSVAVVRTLAPLPLLVALSQAAGVNLALARRQDPRVALLFGVGAVVNLAGAVWLVPRSGALGMAYALLLAEVTVTVLSLLLLRVPARARPLLMRYDWLIVGAGLTGATLAERLAAAGADVLVIDRRAHVAGNAFDEVDEHGVLVHRYGPHAFHTNSERVWRYLSRFTGWHPYAHRVQAVVGAEHLPLPFNLTALDQVFGAEAPRLARALAEAYPGQGHVPVLRMRDHPDAAVREVAAFVYERIFLGYTQKQWGMRPEALDPSVTARVPVRLSHDDRYFLDRYQASPCDGFTALVARMLAHPRITVQTGVAYEDLGSAVQARRLLYTGAVDAFFGYVHGALPYRSLHFAFEHHANSGLVQPVAQLNHPEAPAITRVTEFRHMTGQRAAGTTLSVETPEAYRMGENEPYYPVPHAESRARYARYAREAAAAAPGVVLAGRLGEYRYYNMDQAVARALVLADRLLAGAPLPQPEEAL